MMLNLFTCSSFIACSDVDTESGGEYKPHEIYCDLFYRCLNGRNGKELTVQSCPAGTVYNTLINNCDHLSNSEVAQSKSLLIVIYIYNAILKRLTYQDT